ncbi:acyl-CoA thioesterase [Pseudomonas sp.]|uniref:acyl-CoA thioesterase n=1 Tax=Pseudomonas sp. TaxID=306 RepID=UPI003C728408
MSFVISRTILFGDCDPAGIVYTPRITYFVIEAIHDFLTYKLGAPGIREIFGMGILPPARALSIEFLAPMAWDEIIKIEVCSKEITTTSFTFLVEARNSSNELVFRSTLTQVSVSSESKKPVPIPQRLKEALCST